MNFDWHNEKRRIKDLVPYVANPRQITEKQAKDLKASLERFGVADPIIINTDNTIIGGHQRKKILETLMGVDPDYEIDVRVPDRELSIDEARELNVRLNKNVAEWNFDTLANNFELDDLLDWGFEKSDLDLDLWMPEPEDDPGAQVDRAEELREVWGVESGQMWQLGKHRLICGDCTDKTVVERVMGGEKADLCFTDPPYGVGKEIENDNLIGDDFDNFNALWISLIERGNSCGFVCYHSTRTFKSVLMQAESIGWKFERMLWYYIPDKFPAHSWKHWMMVSQAIMLFSFGDVEYADTESDQDCYRLTSADLGDKHSHPTEKREGNAERVMSHYSGNIVYDPFLGSGTTLIACERLNRKCRAIEISPAYVAVAIQRWVDVTGGVPILLE